MSSAHYFVRNYNIGQVINLLCYNILYPHTLTSQQKITRMYRCFIRRHRELTFHENRQDNEDFFRHQQIAREKLETLMSVSETTPLFKETMDHYETWMRENLDPTLMINPSRAYSPTSGKYLVFSGEQVEQDIYGYYTGRKMTRDPKPGFIHYPDFPQDADKWAILPPFEGADSVEESSFQTTKPDSKSK